MNANLQTAFNSATILPINEQRQLVQMLLSGLNLKNKSNQFWQTELLSAVEKKQGKKFFKKLPDYQASFVPESESVDEWLSYFEQQHQQEIKS